jgi:PPOX class probable F420-dependent enzyme
MPLAPLPDEVVEFLKKPHAAVISTVRSDGAPYSAATWYDWDEGRILVNMDFERLRLSHMRRDPRVAVTVLDIGDWYRAVTVLGTVVEIRDDDGLVDIDRLSVRYRGAPYWNRERKRVSAVIQPERWHEHSVNASR